MATFSALPPEIHDSIAKNCRNNELINLSCTSKWVKELYLPVLYRHVDLRPDHSGLVFMADERKWQDRFFQTLLTHPEYGKHVRFLRALLHIPSYGDRNERYKTMISYEEMWRAMQSLTHVQTVDMGSRNDMAYSTTALTKQFPKDLFRSATSVTLVGRMPYRLAKSILDAVNPATLKYLCLHMVQDWDYGYIPHSHMPHTYMPGDKDEDGRVIATPDPDIAKSRTNFRSLGLGSGCGRTISYGVGLFIRSVQGTVEKFTFELAGEMPAGWLTDVLPAIDTSPFRIADDRFRRIILPAIIAGNWPCLNILELKGVKSPGGQVRTAALIMELTALLGGNTKIVVEEKSHYVEDEYVPAEVFAWLFEGESETS